jgi:hypothetical protein
MVKKLLFACILVALSSPCYCWGFFGHRKINFYAVFLLPPEMMVLYKPNIEFITEHAVDPDKRRYAITGEGPRHYIDLNNYGVYPFKDLPRNEDSAIAKYGVETVQENGVVPWHVPLMVRRLTRAFSEKNFSAILRTSADLGHYIADAHVPLHANSNHNGQLTGQRGIHGFWESRVPELLADKQYDFFIGKAVYIQDPDSFIWARVMESSLASDSVLRFEKELSRQFPGETKYAFEKRNNVTIRQYSSAYTIAFDKKLNGMVERRMRQSIFAVASLWYTAWVNAGQPDLKEMASARMDDKELKELDELNESWKDRKIKGREHE